MPVTVRPMQLEDREPAFRVFVDSYGLGPDTLASLIELPVDERWVAVDEHGDVVGVLRTLPFEQSYGGKAVTSTGVAAVAVALDARSSGVGRALMAGVLEAARDSGAALSTLFMSTIAAYRPVGYEVAGARVRYQYPLEHLPRAQPLPVTAWSDDDLDDVDACLMRIAQRNNGMMIRPRWWWAPRVFGQLEDDTFLHRFRVVEDGRTTGFVVYTTTRERRADFPIQWVDDADCIAIVTRDLMWETEAAGRSLLGFLAAQRALGTNVYWTGPPNDPLMAFMPEHLPRTQSSYQWMNRIVHLDRALTSRGYPRHVAARLEFSVSDDVLAANSGCYRLSVEDGEADVEAIDDAPMSISINGLAALYTGWWSAHRTQSAGLLCGATEADLDALDALFSGGMPWLNEFF